MTATDNAKPLLQLRIRKFRDEPETTFPLYQGENFLGRDPHENTVWLPMQFISARHCMIGISQCNLAFFLECVYFNSSQNINPGTITSLDVTPEGRAWVQDLPKREV